MMSGNIKILFLGDFLLSDEFLKLSNSTQHWNPFIDDALSKLVSSHDVVVGSLDSAVGNGEAPIGGDRIIVRTEACAISTLCYLQMRVMTLATNHAFDFNANGYQNTVSALADLGIQVVGAGRNLDAAAEPLILDVHGLRIGWIAAAAPETSAVIATKYSSGVNTLESVPALERQIKDLRQICDVVIFLPHWGIEWYHWPSPQQRKIAKMLTDSGVDLIIGNHPHVAQMHEFIDGKPVFYALGNATAPELNHTGAEVIKQFTPNRRSIAVSVNMTSPGRVTQLDVYDLFYGVDQHLIVVGKPRPAESHWLLKKFRTQHTYPALWRFYSLIMELFVIPIRYRLFGYGLKYVRQRLNWNSIACRLTAIVNRGKVS